MTARRVYRGASLARHVEPGTAARANLFYELNPHLRPKKKESVILAERIRPWLVEHGPATFAEIAKGVGAKTSSHVGRLFREKRIDGVELVGTRGKGKHKSQVWGAK